jgi:hypothetical protein
MSGIGGDHVLNWMHIGAVSRVAAWFEDLADYLNDTVLDYDEVSYADILEALASLGTTLVEDPVADSTLTNYESLIRPGQESGSDSD